jgi:hypothetical protein
MNAGDRLGDASGLTLNVTDPAPEFLRPEARLIFAYLSSKVQAFAVFARWSRICFIICRMAATLPGERLSIHDS